MGVVAGLTAAAAAASLGSTIANATSGGPSAPSGGGGGVPGTNFGAGFGSLLGAALPPVGNELSALGIPNLDFQPVTTLQQNTPGFSSRTSDSGGALEQNLAATPNVFNESLPGLMSSFGQIAQNAGLAGNEFLSNVLGEGASPLLSPLNLIENARQKAVSDIEGSLAERGLSGSSFATNAVANANETFGNAASQAALQLSQGIFGNQMQTLNQQSQAIQQQESLANAELAREIQQLQIEGGVGTNISDAITRNSSTLAQLAASISAGRGLALTQGLSNLFPTAGSVGNLLGPLGSLLGLAGEPGSNVFTNGGNIAQGGTVSGVPGTDLGSTTLGPDPFAQVGNDPTVTSDFGNFGF